MGSFVSLEFCNSWKFGLPDSSRAPTSPSKTASLSFSQLEGFGDVRIFSRVVQAGHGTELSVVAVDHCNDAVSILFRFVDPGVTFREFGDAFALHWLNESGMCLGRHGNAVNHERSNVSAYCVGLSSRTILAKRLAGISNWTISTTLADSSP